MRSSIRCKWDCRIERQPGVPVQKIADRHQFPEETTQKQSEATFGRMLSDLDKANQDEHMADMAPQVSSLTLPLLLTFLRVWDLVLQSILFLCHEQHEMMLYK